MKRWMASAIVCSLFLGIQDGVRAERLAVPTGTHVAVKLMEEVNSGTSKKGDKLTMTVVSDVRINNKVVIAAGAPAQGTVQNASNRFILGIGGNIDITVDSAKAVDGTTVPLLYTQGAHNGSSLVSLVLTVVCCCIFIFIPGKNVSIGKGTLFESTVVSPVDVTAP